MEAGRLTRAEAEGLCGDVPKDAGWKPASWSFRRNGTDCLVKDVRYCAPFYRFFWGRLFLWREALIYGKLAGLPFVPRFFGRLDADALVMEKVDAPPLTRFRGDDLDPAFYDRLEACVAALHARGVVHFDLRHRSNILVAPGGAPVLIDFASALHLGTGPLGRLLVPLLGAVDRSGVMKYRVRDFPGRATPEDLHRIRTYRVLHWLWPFDRIRRLFKRRPSDPRGPEAR